MKIYFPFIQFRTNATIIYYQADSPGRRSTIPYSLGHNSSSFSNSKEVESQKTYTGKVTAGSQKRIAKAVSLLIQASPEKRIFNPVTGKHQNFKLSFITLTVSDAKKNYTAKECYKQLLEPFILRLRRRYGVKSYIWKAELQKRGQIHYHLTTNVFIHFSDLRNDWNNLQRKAGYLDNYFQKKGHYDANSTDVHSVVKIKNIEAYLVKYLAKKESEKESTIGKIWDCSQNLKKYNYFTEFLDSELEEKLQILEDSGKARRVIKDRFQIVYFQDYKPTDLLNSNGKNRYEKFIQEINA